MRGNTELLHDILAKFRFIEPASPELQQHIRKIKKYQFRKTLKRTAGYSFVFSLVAYLFFVLKKLGINITIMKTAAVLAVSSSVAAVAAGTGVYHAVRIIIKKPEVRIEQRIKEKEQPREKTINTIESDQIKNAAKYGTEFIKAKIKFIEKGIGIQQFSALNVESPLTEKVTDVITDELGRLKGRERVINFRKPNDARTGAVLRGSVELLDNNYKITAKVIDVETLKILFYTSESVDSIDKLDDASCKIAQKIAESGVIEK